MQKNSLSLQTSLRLNILNTSNMPPLIKDDQTQKAIATLIHPDTGDRVGVTEQNKQDYFGKGYVLEQSPNTPVKGAVQAGTGKVMSGQPYTAAGKFVDVVQKKAAEQITAKRDALLNAPENYDTQIALQRGALFEALANGVSALTPENLRWLSPQQQQMIRDGKKDLMSSAIVGLNSILETRKDLRKEEQARQDKLNTEARAEAKTALEIYSKNNLWDKVSEEERSKLESSLGLAPGTIGGMASKDGFTYELKPTERGGYVQFKFDSSGKLVGQEEVRASSARAGSTTTSTTGNPDAYDFKEFVTEFQKSARFSIDSTPGSTGEAELKKLYSQYQAEVESKNIATYINGVAYSPDAAKKAINSTDRQKMMLKGLNPDSVQDIKKYVEEIKGDTKGNTAGENMSPERLSVVVNETGKTLQEVKEMDFEEANEIYFSSKEDEDNPFK